MNQRDCQKAPQGRGTSGERGGGWELKGRCEGDRSVGNRECVQAAAFTKLTRSVHASLDSEHCHHVWF